jgi:ACS family glucarate transporter-like MFS transporter
MYPYLQEHYRLSPAEAARYAMIPLIAGATSQWIAGFVVDLLCRSRWRAWSRRLPAMGGFLVAAGGVFALTLAETPVAVVACFTIATFGTEVTISPSWSFCLDIGAANSGAVSGIMNMAGNLGAFASATAFPLMSRLTGNTTAYFQLAALMDVGAMACWVWMRSLSASASEGVVC